MLKPIFSILCLSTLLVSCGGASSTGSPGQGPGTPGSGATTKWYDDKSDKDIYPEDKKVWRAVLDEQLTRKATFSAIKAFRRGDTLYFNIPLHGRPNLFSTKDNKVFKSYFTPSYTSLAYVSDAGWIYLHQYYSKDGKNFLPIETAGSTFYLRDIEGDDNWVIGLSGSRYQHSGRYAWVSPGITSDASLIPTPDNVRYLSDIKAGDAEPAFNGVDTFAFVGRKQGIWVTNKLAQHWTHRLKNLNDFQALSANKNFPNQIFVARPYQIYKSNDSGVSWYKINTPKLANSEIAQWLDMELLDDGGLVAVGMLDNKNGMMQVFDSRDFGKTWHEVGGSIKIGSIQPAADLLGTSDYYYLQFNNSIISTRRK